jgi:hypothetical protein
MALYSTQEEFLTQGIITRSLIPYDDPDCPIRKDVLKSTPTLLQSLVSIFIQIVLFLFVKDDQEEPFNFSQEELLESEDHPATKMPCCNNTVSYHCLLTWLRTSNTCPFCRANLFPSYPPAPDTPGSLLSPEEWREGVWLVELNDTEFFMEE